MAKAAELCQTAAGCACFVSISCFNQTTPTESCRHSPVHNWAASGTPLTHVVFLSNCIVLTRKVVT
jgi:hypothetical protein